KLSVLSGVYDLEPVRLSYVNHALRLDPSSAQRNSPLHYVQKNLPPIIIARGKRETSEYIRQHDEFIKQLKMNNHVIHELVIEHRNHFDLPFDLSAPDSILGNAILFDE